MRQFAVYAIANRYRLEQEQIAHWLDLQLGKIDLIREYRTRLVADMVTGKLDVRGVELPKAGETVVLGDFDNSEAVADLAEELDEVEGIQEEDAG